MSPVRVFAYVERLDAFVVTDEYSRIAERLGLAEWNPVVWIGRLFALDNDYGEHWLDNWDERAALEDETRRMGIPSERLMILVPGRFEDGEDGPCHPPALRKRFWTDVLKSLELSYETLFEKARERNALAREDLPCEFIEDLEERISEIRSGAGKAASPEFTQTQGRYLAFIHHYGKVHGQPPAEADIQRYMKVTLPAIHQMILTLEKRGFIERTPGQARSVRVLIPPEELPDLA